MPAGFTLIELLLVILIAGIIGTIAIPQFSRVTSVRAANNARDAFIATASQARAAAIQMGEEVELVVQTGPRLLTVRVAGTNEVIRQLDMANGDIQAGITGQDFTVCYVPRGYARPGCTDSIEVGFVSPQGRDTAWANLAPGQVTRR